MRRRTVTTIGALALVLSACGGPTDPATTGSAPGSAQAGASTPATAGSGAPTTSTPPPGTITLGFGGDVHFEEYVAALLKDPHNSLADLRPTLGAADWSMVNLETAITTGGTRQNKSFTFRAPATSLTTLAAAGVDAVSLANNHAVDFGASGLADTLAAKKASPIPVVGIGADAAEAYAPTYVEIKGVRVAVFAALQLWEETASNWSAGPSKGGVATTQTPAKLALLRESVRAAAAKADLVIVMMHWGTEYATCADAQQAATARALEADGADIIVGGHAHRQQGGGWLGRSYVGYGLGNFVWWRSAEPEASSGVLTLTVDAAAARARGAASGAARRTASSLVTKAVWQPLLIGADGVPRPPAKAADVTRLQGVWEKAIRCSGLRSTA